MHPHLFQIGPVLVPTFGAVAALGLVLAIALAARCAVRLGISDDSMWNLCYVTAIGTLVLSRLIIIAQAAKAFVHYPLYILTLPTVTRYGLLAAIASGAAYIFFKQMPWLRSLDALAPAALLLQSALHLGSLFAGDDLGDNTTSWLGRIIHGDEGHHPVALYAAILTLIACGITYAWLQRETQPGEAFGLGLALTALVRFFVDTFRPGYVLPDIGIPNFLRIDQIILIVLTSAGLCFFFTRKPRHAQ
jgi:phosphatidylglycerol---prolipoprotein diacylglyceryl transferase